MAYLEHDWHTLEHVWHVYTYVYMFIFWEVYRFYGEGLECILLNGFQRALFLPTHAFVLRPSRF